MMSSHTVSIVRSASYFPVADVAAVGAHYRNVLGFACEYSAGDPPVFAVYRRGGAAVMLRLVENPALICPNERQGGTWDLFAWVDDVEALFAELTARRAAVVYPPVVQPYGMKEFAVRDPSGHVLGFGQEWPGTCPGV